LKQQFNRFLRWILFLWIRVEVFPDNNPASVLDPERPTLYVLADRGLSDLLVLSQITERGKLPDPLAHIPIELRRRYYSVYSIASRSPLGDWLKRRRKHSAMLGDLMQAFADNAELSLQVVPVSVFWGRPLARQKHWFQVIFADTWVLAGRIRKLFTILIHGRNTRLIFSRPLDFRDLINQSDNDALDLQETLIATLRQQREATFGPETTSHKHLSAKVIEDNIVQKLISTETSDSQASLTRAQGYCREIFANCTQLTIELMLRLLRVFWNRFYADIQIYNADRIREAALTQQLVYVPCHRSHVDYLLLSYVIYNENLALPYIAAGDNLNIPFIGRILRGGGAFFIRRSFKDNAVYGAVMRAYLKQLIDLGVPLEYFIEGGRSRSGKMLKPKFGMLGMTVDGYIRTRKRALAFVPVYIGYEKLIEGNSYLGELYGERKKSESTLGALTAIFRLKGHFGKVTASFGEPIELGGLLKRHCSDWHNRADEVDSKPDWYRASLQQLAREIMNGINRACVINPVNAIATILLATPRHSIEIEELVSQAKLHRRLINGAPFLASIRIEGKVNRKQISRIVKQKIIHIRKHELGDIVYLKPEDAVLIGYYRNNSLHSLVIPALIACCFTNLRRVSRASLHRKIGLLYPFLKSELQLEWQESSLQQIVDECIACLVDESMLVSTETDLRRPRRSDRKFIQLIRLAQIVQPILERYYMTFIVLWQTTGKPLEEAELEHRCHLLAQKISMIYGINSPDFFDRLLFRDFIETMLENEYLQKNDQQQLEFTPGLDYLSLDLRNLLSTEVRSSILSLVKAAPHETTPASDS
jgi:glycerol-3-phosphate O-acyltransferase